MRLPEFLHRFDGFVGFLVDAIICALAASAYQGTRKRCLVFICTGAAIGAVLVVLREFRLAWAGWYFVMFLRILGDAAWLFGLWLLLRDYTALVEERAQPGAPPNGGPAMHNSGASGGPPSVS